MPVATARLALVLSLLAVLCAAPAQAQWINELHYDNVGVDTGEAVEVVLPSTADPADFDLYLYNGNGGVLYDGPLNLATDFTEGESVNGFTVYSATFPPNGLQNGDPDGLALTVAGDLVPGQFLSYEGSFVAADGPAAGETSADIGVAEASDTPVGLSLQLVGSGLDYDAFEWQAPAPGSFGSVNDGQAVASPPARVQIIHNAPDPAADTVDVGLLRLAGEPALTVVEDVPFRGATAFLDVQPGMYAVSVSSGDGSGSLLIEKTGITFEAGESYQLIVSGVGDGDFEANPDGIDTAFTLLVNPDARLTSSVEDNVELNFVHGTPDAPAVDVRTGATQDIILFDDVPYAGQAGYQPIAPEPQNIEVTTADGVASLGQFEVDLTGRADQAGTLLASGFLTPDNEDDTNGTPPGFGLLVVFADGTEEFVPPMSVANEDGAGLPAAFALRGSYPNPFASRTAIRYDLPADGRVGLEVFDVLGRRVLGLAPEPVAAGAGRTLAVEAVLPSGVYLYRLTAETAGETRTETGRMTVVR